MRRLLVILIFSLVCCTNLSAQLGVSQLAKTNIGQTTIARTDPGRDDLPVCAYPRKCAPTDCAVFTFIGSGSWEEPSNWEFGLTPPVVLEGCYEIRIRPAGDTKAVMIVPETVLNGGKIIVEAGKQMIIPGQLIIRQ
jgi:hypothetical protein